MVVVNRTACSVGALLLMIVASAPRLVAQDSVGMAPRKPTPTVDASGAMIKMVFMLKRRPGMSRADFIQYYESHHARLGEKYVPNAVRYVRRFLDPVPGPWSKPADEFDVMTELWFANKQEADRAMAHLSEPKIHDEIAADEERLFDRSRSQVYLITEHESVMSHAEK
jgi:EthD domain